MRGRLAAIPEDPSARRFERTTTVPLIDTLLPVLGVSTGFLLAAQIRAGNIDVEGIVLSEGEAPRETERSLAARYRPGSIRYKAAASALAYLHADGVRLDRSYSRANRLPGPRGGRRLRSRSTPSSSTRRRPATAGPAGATFMADSPKRPAGSRLTFGSKTVPPLRSCIGTSTPFTTRGRRGTTGSGTHWACHHWTSPRNPNSSIPPRAAAVRERHHRR